MPTNLFDAPTGAGYDKMDPSAPGTQGYENNIVSRATRNLKPAYQQAMGGLRQSYASRGLLDSGLEGQAEGDLSQGYLNNLGGIAEGAATHGADVNEENRRRVQQRGWQTQDRDIQMNWLQQQANQAKEQADQAR